MPYNKYQYKIRNGQCTASLAERSQTQVVLSPPAATTLCEGEGGTEKHDDTNAISFLPS